MITFARSAVPPRGTRAKSRRRSGAETGRDLAIHPTAVVANPIAPALAAAPISAPTAAEQAYRQIMIGGSGIEFPASPERYPDAIALGPDGATWFTEDGTDSIGRVAADGTEAEFPTATASGFRPRSIAAGPDGDLWFTDWQGDVGRLDPADGQVTKFALPDGSDAGRIFGAIFYGNGGPIVAGSDGALWFLGVGEPWVGRITTDGAIAEFPIPAGDNYPTGLVAGPDGALWFGLTADSIGRMDTDGNFTRIDLPAGSTSDTTPHALTFDAAGDLWFFRGNALDEMTPDGTIAPFPIPGVAASAYVDRDVEGITSMVAGTDGALWFAMPGTGDLGRVAPDGSIDLFPLATGATPQAVVIGEDGDLSYTDPGANAIGHLTLPQSLDAYPDDIAFTPGVTFAGPVADFDDPNLVDDDPGDPATYSASIDWGDGTTSVGVVASDGDGSFTVNGSHAFGPGGPYAVTVTLASLATTSPLPAPAAAVVTAEASVILPGMPTLPIPVFLPGFGDDGGLAVEDSGAAAPTSAAPVAVAVESDPVPPVAIPVVIAVAAPIPFEGPVASASDASSAGSPALALVAVAAPATAPVVASSSGTTTVEVAASYPLVPSSSSASAMSIPSARRTSVIVANSSLRPVATAPPSRSGARRVRRQVAKPKPAGPRAIPAKPQAQVTATPEVRAGAETR